MPKGHHCCPFGSSTTAGPPRKQPSCRSCESPVVVSEIKPPQYQQGTYISERISDSHTDIQTYRHTDIQTYIHTHTHTYTYIYIHTHTYIYIHIHTYTYIYIHIHTYTYIYIHIHTYTYTYIHIHTYLPTYSTYIHAYIHACMHASYIHTCIHTSIHPSIHTHTHTYIHTLPLTRLLELAMEREILYFKVPCSESKGYYILYHIVILYSLCSESFDEF